MSDGDGINVGILRAELAALELRVVDRITAALAQKADSSHVEALERDIQIIKSVGSPSVIRVQQDLTELTKKLNEVEKIQLERQHLVPQIKEDHEDLQSLKGWRNKLIGGFALTSVIAVINGLRVWAGLG